MLFNQKDFKSYSPYGKSENYKCVSLINGTGKNRSYFSDFGDKEVIVKGRVAEYDKLSSGTSAADKFLSKKYFGGEVVENYCLRDFVFIVESMELKGNSRPD